MPRLAPSGTSYVDRFDRISGIPQSSNTVMQLIPLKAVGRWYAALAADQTMSTECSAAESVRSAARGSDVVRSGSAGGGMGEGHEVVYQLPGRS